MNSYLEKLHANQIHFPNAHENLLRNLFYLADRLKDEEEIRMNIYNGFENYRDCVEDEGLKGNNITDIGAEQKLLQELRSKYPNNVSAETIRLVEEVIRY